MKKKALCLVLGLMMALVMTPAAWADGEWKVTLGNDLTQGQREEVFDMLGVDRKSVV